MATKQELEAQALAAQKRATELYQNYQTVRRIARENASFDTDGSLKEWDAVAREQPDVIAARAAWKEAGISADEIREQASRAPSQATPTRLPDIDLGNTNTSRTTWEDPAADNPITQPEPFTATPQTSTADQPIPFISDETYLDPLYEPAPTSPTVEPLPASPWDINKDGVVSDSEYLYGDDPLYEPVPTDEDLASIQERMDQAEEDALFAEQDAIQDGVNATGFTSEQADEVLSGREFDEFEDDSFPTPPATRPPRSIKDSRKPIVKGDWRFRVRLSPFADYLYNAPDAGILAPLRATDGVVFPYTPSITVANNADYASYQPTHSNFRGFFYKGSYQQDILVRGTFTAQDTAEAQYMLAMMHFFKSATRMFYGNNDNRRGTPPPLLYLNGLGEYGFNEHACLLGMFTYDLPDNVDYIKTSNTTSASYAPSGKLSSASGHQSWNSKITRLLTGGLEDFLSGNAPSIPNFGGNANSVLKITDGATYVPTQLNVQLNFHPVNSREQISNEYNMNDFASGKLLKKGYW